MSKEKNKNCMSIFERFEEEYELLVFLYFGMKNGSNGLKEGTSMKRSSDF